VSALATRLLAREDAGDLAILGSGVQARSHLRAMREVRTIRRVRAWSPTRSRLESFVAEASTADLGVEAAASAREAVAGADLVCVATSARVPVLQGAWLGAGTHVNAIGASMPDARELDTAAIAGARLFVDLRSAALAEAGDVVIPLREGAITERHIEAELGELAAGLAQGRRTRDEVTVFKSVGLAIEDAAAAHEVHARAEREGLGTVVALRTPSGD
jgi:ornithine cyclodeaminase